MLIIGTAHFVSRPHAVIYYRKQHATLLETVRAVDAKLRGGEIHIGPPRLLSGQTLIKVDGGARYAIEDGRS